MNICDRCGAPSVYRSKLIVNGVSQSTNLCRDCAIKEGVFNNQPTRTIRISIKSWQIISCPGF